VRRVRITVETVKVTVTGPERERTLGKDSGSNDEPESPEGEGSQDDEGLDRLRPG
jgi:hypothetical protein